MKVKIREYTESHSLKEPIKKSSMGRFGDDQEGLAHLSLGEADLRDPAQPQKQGAKDAGSGFCHCSRKTFPRRRRCS